LTRDRHPGAVPSDVTSGPSISEAKRALAEKKRPLRFAKSVVLLGWAVDQLDFVIRCGSVVVGAWLLSHEGERGLTFFGSPVSWFPKGWGARLLVIGRDYLSSSIVCVAAHFTRWQIDE
jgi:hypothetical protein